MGTGCGWRAFRRVLGGYSDPSHPRWEVASQTLPDNFKATVIMALRDGDHFCREQGARKG